MTKIVVSCYAKNKFSMNGDVTCKFRVVEDAEENKEWSDGMPKGSLEVVLNRTAHRQYEVGDQYVLTLEPIEFPD